MAETKTPTDTKDITETQDTVSLTESNTPDDLRKIADRLVIIAKKQYEAAVKYRQPKLDKILKAEELYFNVVTRTIKGRFNVPLPIVSGFVDTLLAKIDDEITVNFDHVEEADKIKCRKITAGIKYDSSPTRGMWGIKDILVKKLAIFSGRGIYEIFSESDPRYKNYFDGVDLFDFLEEPTGGWWLNNHLFCGRDNIFRTKYELENGVQYDKRQVESLFSKMGESEFKKSQEQYLNRMKRHNSLGLDPESNNYVGVDIANLVQWNMYDSETGKRYFMFFEPRAGIWVRIQPLEEITGEPEEGDLPSYMWKSFATHTDYWNFLSKAPVDDVVPIAVAMKTVVNFMLDETQKSLWGQRLFDPEMISDPSQLEWDRPDKLIQTLVPQGKKLSDAVWQFPTGDKSTVTIDLLDYMRNFAGTEAGVTGQEKGNSDDKLLGIAQINQGEVADRLGLTNKQYCQCYAEIGDAWLRGYKMCMTEKQLIRIIGENGAESHEITRDDLKFSSMPDVRITGGKTESRRNQQLQEAKSQSLETVATLFPNLVNAKIAAENILRNGQWKLDEIGPILDPSISGDEDESVKASQAIQDILAKKKPALYTGATTRFMKKILDYATKRTEDDAIKAGLARYAIAHTQIVVSNMQRMQMLAQLNPSTLNPAAPAGPVAPGGSAPAPGAPIQPGQGQPTPQPGAVASPYMGASAGQ